MRHAKVYHRGSRVKAPIFFAALALLAALSLAIPLRPEKSNLEGRDLTPFPEFSTGGLLSGEFFHGIDDWFSDTFPFREQCLRLGEGLRSLYGIKTVTIHGTVGKADDIPDAPFMGNVTTARLPGSACAGRASLLAE